MHIFVWASREIFYLIALFLKNVAVSPHHAHFHVVYTSDNTTMNLVLLLLTLLCLLRASPIDPERNRRKHSHNHKGKRTKRSKPKKRIERVATCPINPGSTKGEKSHKNKGKKKYPATLHLLRDNIAQLHDEPDTADRLVGHLYNIEYNKGKRTKRSKLERRIERVAAKLVRFNMAKNTKMTYITQFLAKAKFFSRRLPRGQFNILEQLMTKVIRCLQSQNV